MTLRALVLLPAALSGCVFINSFDDVKPEGNGTGGGGSSSGGSAGDDAGAGGNDVDGGGGTGGGTGGGGGSGGQGAGGDAGTDAPVFVPGGDNGAVVLFSNGALRVLDPANGEEEIVDDSFMRTVDSIIHDGVSDYWYIFERGGTLMEPGTLHVRQLDTDHWAWREVSTRSVALPSDGKRAAVLNQRIVYLGPPDTEPTLTVLDTSDPEDVQIVVEGEALPAGQKFGILARRAAGGGVGGRGNLVLKSNCTAGLCDMSLVSIQVDATGASLGTTTRVGELALSESGPGFTDDLLNNANVLVEPPLGPPGDAGAWVDGCQMASSLTADGAVTKYNPLTHAPTTAAVRFNVLSSIIAGTAHSPCGDITFVSTGRWDSGIFAIPADASGTPSRVCLSVPGGPLFYEPFTNTLLTATQQGLTAYTIGGTASAPTLTPKTLSTPPGLVLGPAVAVRQGAAQCPMP